MKTLKAKEGYYLTQSADVAIQDRVISDCLYLPDTVDVSTWKEITDTQATDYRKQLETYNASLTSTDVVDNSLTEAIEKKLKEIDGLRQQRCGQQFYVQQYSVVVQCRG
jgi:hypothetical protein